MKGEHLGTCVRSVVVFFHDVGMAGLSVPLSLGLHLGFDGLPAHAHFLAYAMPLFCGLAAIVFYDKRLYRGLWRYATVGDLLAICKAAATAVLLFVLAIFAIDRLETLPRTAPVIQLLSLIFLMAGSRFGYRVWIEERSARRAARTSKQHLVIPILLLGSSQGANLLIRVLRQRLTPAPYRVVGIIMDLAESNMGREILGVPILGTIEQLPAVLDHLSKRGERPHRIILTTRLGEAQLLRIQKVVEAAHVPLSRLPSLTDFRVASEQWQLDLRPIAAEDLLCRPQIPLDQDGIDRLIGGRRVLITGAGGSIGSELCRSIALRVPAEMILLDNSEFNLYTISRELESAFPHVVRRAVLTDIRDRHSLGHLFSQCQPQLIFHAAALKHVPLVEFNPIEGVLTNVLGTRNVAEAAGDCGALAFVQVSTDKAINPKSVMGATKRMAELFCQSLDQAWSNDIPGSAGEAPHTQFVTVRFGNVLGSSGSVVNLFQEQLRRGGPLTITHRDITRYFMTIGEAVELILKASTCSLNTDRQRGRIFVLEMGEPIRIMELAEKMIQLAGLTPHKDIPIEIIGLRPGEKLSEELFDPSEERLPSEIAGVRVAKSKPLALREMKTVFARLEALCAAGDTREVLREIVPRVPGYRLPDEIPAARSLREPFVPAAGSRWTELSKVCGSSAICDRRGAAKL